MHQPTILILPGSLRAQSSTMVVVRHVQTLLEESGAHVVVYAGIGQLPHFDGAEIPDDNVMVFRELIAQSDAVIVCTPEYAFGVPGSLKNALDWTVSSGSLVNKPLGLITASTGGEKAHAAFIDIFTALSAQRLEQATLLIPFIRAKINADHRVADPATLEALGEVVKAVGKGLGVRGWEEVSK